MTPVDIVNAALDELKARATITSINPSDGSVAANAAARQYPIRIPALMRAAHWNCLKYQGTLSLLKAAVGTPENPNGASLPLPPTPWLYEYAWPTNPLCLKARSIVPVLSQANVAIPMTTAGGIIAAPYIRGGVIPFQVSTDLDASGNQIRVILTNMSQAQLVYTSQVADPTLWDSSFTEAAVAVMASFLCGPVNGNTELAGMLAQKAKELILMARIADGNEGPQTSDHVPDWISIRYGGSGLGAVSPVAGWDAMTMFDGSVI